MFSKPLPWSVTFEKRLKTMFWRLSNNTILSPACLASLSKRTPEAGVSLCSLTTGWLKESSCLLLLYAKQRYYIWLLWIVTSHKSMFPMITHFLHFFIKIQFEKKPTGSHSVVYTGLKLRERMLASNSQQSSWLNQCWDYRHELLHSVLTGISKMTQPT